jgi:hypothetical protein
MATAHHEAGHAITARELFLGVTSVSIEPTGDTLGQMSTTEGGEPFSPTPFSAFDDRGALAEKQLTGLMAGPIAEALYSASPVTTRERDRHWSFDDLRKAEEVCGRLTQSPEAQRAYYDWLFYRTRDFLRTPLVWSSVQAVAAALLERGRLTGKEMDAVIHESFGQFHPNGPQPQGNPEARA